MEPCGHVSEHYVIVGIVARGVQAPVLDQCCAAICNPPSPGRIIDCTCYPVCNIPPSVFAQGVEHGLGSVNTGIYVVIVGLNLLYQGLYHLCFRFIRHQPEYQRQALVCLHSLGIQLQSTQGVSSVADGSGNAHMTWLALTPLATQRNMGNKGTGAVNVYGHFTLVEPETGTNGEPVETEGIMYRTDKITHNQACASLFTITANEALSLRIVYTCSAESNWDMMSVRVGDDWIITGFANPNGVTGEKTYVLAAGETLEVLAQWVKDSSVDSGRDCAEITFISEGDFSIEKTEPTKTIAAGGSAGGWPKMPLRERLETAVLPCFPENVRNAILPVRKVSAITATEQVESVDSIWIPSRREYCKANPMEKSGVMYDGAFDGTRYPIAKKGIWPGVNCWTRSRNGDNNFYVITNPASESNESVQNNKGVIIGFCI